MPVRARCPHCSALFEGPAESVGREVTCKQCERPFTIEQTSDAASAERPPDDLMECPYCAETIKARAKKCRFCGERLDTSDVAADSPPPPVVVVPAYAAPPIRSSSDDAINVIIPYRNAPALVSYYLGIFSILPIVGTFMGITAVILGIMGLRKASQNPQARGKVHAWVGIITGFVFGFVWIALLLLASLF